MRLGADQRVTSAVPPAVWLHRVSVRRAGTLALREVSLSVAAGERVALLGSSGAGKSTLLAVVNALLSASSGEVQVLGTRLSSLSVGELRRLRMRIGSMHQHLDLVGPLRVVHNVNAGQLGSWSLPRAAWSLVRPNGVAEATTVLERVGLADRIFDRTDELSGGQLQRVALARVLLQDPDLILADEPVSSLDPALASQVMQLLTDLAGDRTVLASLHNPELAKLHFDRVVGLSHGEVVFDVDSDALTEEALRALYG